jgi:hypothetical protein
VTVRGSWRLPALLVLGTLLMQAAWVLALPPFRGTDEFDHAYRAAAVADGQWRSPGHEARHGRGDLVTVPRSLVAAAHPVCSSYAYTGHDNCNPATLAAGDRVQVASVAARYQPVFYWLVGSVAKPFSGVGALYAMRIAAALLCAAFVGLAASATRRWSRTVWPWVGLVVSASPVVMFSTAVVAPNGLEMCAALSLWGSLLGLLSADAAVTRHERALLVGATVSAVVLTTLRSIGPLWVALVVLTAVIPCGPRRVVALVRRTPVMTGVCSAIVVAASLASVWWTRSSGTTALELFDTGVTNRWTATLGQVPLWLLQSIAAFPRRGDPAPGAVYVCAGLVFIVLVICGFVSAGRRWRTALAVAVGVTLAVPLVTTVLTITTAGAFWQGRYGLPYAFGTALLAAAGMDSARTARRGLWLVLGWLLLLVAQVASVVHVLQVEARTSPLAGSSSWITAPSVVVGLLTTTGFALWGMAVIVAARSAEPRLAAARSDSLAP